MKRFYKDKDFWSDVIPLLFILALVFLFVVGWWLT